MADPVTVDCPVDVWTNVGTNQVWGHLSKKSKKPNVYLYTYRNTGNPAPTLRSEGIPIFIDTDRHLILSGDAVDVYIMPIGAAGSIRADYYI